MRLRILGLLAGLALGLLLSPLVADAQQAVKIPQLGYLDGTSLSVFSHYVEAFRQGLRAQGYIEGQNIVIEYRWAEGKLDRLPELAAELVRLKVDVIYAPTTRAAVAAKAATRTTPIVFGATADPVGSGLVASLARPGGNLTGLTFLGAELVPKRLELLREVVPGTARVAVLRDPGAHAERTIKAMLEETGVAARALGVQLLILEARGSNDLEPAFSAMVRERAGALLTLPSPIFSAERRRLVNLAAKHRLPAVYFDKTYVEAGGLMSYGASITDNHRRAATYVAKILRGAKPADLPVEQPTRFELVVNLKTAKTLGLTIPPSVLVRADEVIQ